MKTNKYKTIRNIGIAVCAVGLLSFAGAVKAEGPFEVPVTIANKNYAGQLKVKVYECDKWGNQAREATFSPIIPAGKKATFTIPLTDRKYTAAKFVGGYLNRYSEWAEDEEIDPFIATPTSVETGYHLRLQDKSLEGFEFVTFYVPSN